MISSWRGFYSVMAVAVVTVLLYYALGTRPLLRQEREVERQLLEASERLQEVGLGRNAREVSASIEQVEGEIEALAVINRDRSRGIQFDPEVEEMLGRPFALLDFEQRRYLVADQLESRASSAGVELFDELEAELPAFEPGMERPYLLWAQLIVIEQLVSSAIDAGVGRIDVVQLLGGAADERDLEGEKLQHEIPVRIEVTGPMDAVRRFLVSLPLNDEELHEVGSTLASDREKSPFFIKRFIFRKASRERADEVVLELVASGFLDLRTVR